MSLIYKILPQVDWQAAKTEGAYRGSPLDLKDGFIHFSTAEQARETARLHFGGQSGLVIVAFEAADLSQALQWETSRGGALFPHLYGPIDPKLARAETPLALNADGWPEPTRLELRAS